MRRTAITISALFCGLACPRAGHSQRPVTLGEAIQSALTIGPRIAIVRADSLAAAAQVLTARAFPNPTISPAYTRSPPNYHVELEQPFEYPFLRAARVRAATLGAGAAAFLAAAERASIRYDVEVAYADAAAGVLIRALSRRNLADAQEMLRITQRRQQAGDASELDIRLAAVSAGQAELQMLADSLQTLRSLLELQTLMGLSAARIEIAPSDSLAVRFPVDSMAPAPPLRVAAAQLQVDVEHANLAAARAARIPALALRVGVEWHEPDVGGLEPIIGIALPLPIFDRNRGPIAEARAAQDRAAAQLMLAQLQTRNALLLAQQERSLAQSRVQRGGAMVAEAERVATLALTAYREGAYALASVIEAQRNARDAVRSYIEALQASRVAQAALVRAQVVGGPMQ
ncbi:MAG TPA: TolC family protein [Longimicrobiales bacterium]